MSDIPAALFYTKEHVWVKVEGSEATLGVTDYAQDQLGDILFVDLPDIGEDITAGDVITEFESTRTTYEVSAPISGRIIASNEELNDTPELINEDPYGSWIVKVKLSDESELDDLLTDDDYEMFTEK